MKKLFTLAAFLLSAVGAAAQGDTTAMGNTGVADFPNYHPLIVHFPLILLLAAAVMQIVLLFYRSKAFNYTIVAFTVIGFVTGLLAATIFHAHPAHDINPTAHEIFETHEKFAITTLWLSGIASLFKIAGLFVPMKWLEYVALLLLLGSAATVTVAGHRGSELVYKQGIGPQGAKLEEEHQH